MSIRFLKQLPTDTFEKQSFANQAINEILDGEVSVLEAFAMLKHIEDIISVIKADPSVLGAFNTELDKYPKGQNATALGYTLSRGERKNWDYSETGDYQFQALKVSEAELKDKIKSREKFLQSLNQKIVDAENGGFEINPPKVTFTTYPILKEVKQSVEMPANSGLPF